jgi:hypothetical protein
MIYNQDDDGARALFFSWKRLFWRRWICGSVLVVFGPLLQKIDHCSGTFLLCNSFLLCASLLPLGHCVGCN